MVYLNHSETGIDVVYGLTAVQAHSLMSKGFDKALNILVEDSVAKAIVSEILRRFDAKLLSMVNIFPAGGAEIIKSAMRTVSVAKLSLAAVLDGDKPATAKENIFKLPGTEPPEKQIFASVNVRNYVQTTYGLNLSDFATGLVTVDHHEWLKRLAQHLVLDEAALTWEVARVFAREIPEPEAASLVKLLQEASRK